MTENASEEFVGKKLAAAIGAALLLGFVVVITVAAYDNSRLTTLEQMTEPTAVGDHVFFPVPEKIDPEKTAVNFRGQPLHAVERIKYRDGEMLKVGMDDSSSFVVYRADSKKPEVAGFYFVKTAVRKYLKLKTSPK